MTYNELATINITLQSGAVQGQGFGIALFASAHRYFSERVKTYTSLADAATELPTNSNAYKAVENFFSSTPSPQNIKIGRREADLDLTVAAASTAGAVTVFANDGTTTYSVDVDVSGQADEDAVATAIAAAIEADADVGPLVVASATTDTVSIVAANSDYTYYVRGLSTNITETYTTSESAADLLAALEQEDSNFYVFMCDDHSETFVLAAASAIEARTKMYFFSVQEQAALTAYVNGSANDILGKVSDESYIRTKGMFDDAADTDYPEATWVGYNLPYLSGSITWANVKLSNSATKDPSTGFLLNASQKGYLEARNAAYIERIGNFNVVRNGTTAGGEAVDVVRGRDNLESDLNLAYINLLINQQGSKVPYTDDGIVALESVCEGVLFRYVNRNFINNNFKITFPRINQVPDADKSARIYRLGTFEAELTNAIEAVTVNGNLAITL